MKKFNKLSAKIGAAMTVAMSTCTMAFATDYRNKTYTSTALDTAVQPVANLIYALLNPALVIVGAVGSLYCVILGVKYAKCEEPQEREKAKGALKNAVIGFLLIFVLMVALVVVTPSLKSWVDSTVNNNTNGFGGIYTIFGTSKGTK